MSVKREVKHHIEVEPEWEQPMKLQLYLGRVHSLMLAWAASDPSLLDACISTVAAIMEREAALNRYLEEEKSLAGVGADCISNPVELNHVSVHLQLNRLLSALISQACHVFSSLDPDWILRLKQLFARFEPIKLMDPCLRVVVLAAQVVYANMWKRNGFSLLNQVHLYYRMSGRIHMYDQDISLLQMCACLAPSSDVFLINVLNKFHSKLIDWFQPRHEAKVTLEDLSKTYIALIEEFLYLLIVLLSERHSVLGQNVSQSRSLQYELVHLLMLGVCSHSEIVKKVTLVS